MSALLFPFGSQRRGDIPLAEPVDSHWVAVQRFASEFVRKFFACFQVGSGAAASEAFGGKLYVDTLRSLVDITSGDGTRHNPMN